MKITIETTADVTKLPNGSRGAVCEGVTDDGVPVLVVLTSIGCEPEHRAALERSMHEARRCSRRRKPRRCGWRDRLFGTPTLN